MKWQFKTIIAIFAGLIGFQTTFSINTRYIKDTYTILNPEFKHLSPAHGPVWWERQLAENNYKYAGDPLAKYLFNVPQAQAGVEHFVITESEFFPVTYFSSKSIGRLIGAIERNRQAIIDAQYRVAAIQQKKAPQKGQLSAKQIASKKEMIVLAANLKKDLAATLANDKDFKVRFDDYLGTLSEDQRKITQSKMNTILDKMLTALISSLKESGFFDLIGDINAQLFVPNQTYNLIYAYLMRMAQEERDGKNIGKSDIKGYFDGLSEQLGNAIFTPDGFNLYSSKEWLQDTFSEKEIVRAQVSNAVMNASSLNSQLLDQLYEKMVYLELSSGTQGLPEMAAYINHSLFMGKKFTNCADTMIRNLCNVALFDPIESIFTFERIKNANPIEASKDFYAQFYNANDIAIETIHNAWNLVVQNRPFVAYERVVDLRNPGARAAVGNRDFKGFILADPAIVISAFSKMERISFSDGSTREFPLVEIGGTQFCIVDPNQYAVYEIEPTMRNIIILMNEVLGLSLYSNIATAFFEKKFSQKYFAALCERLNWRPKEGVDVGAQKINTIIYTKGGSLSLYLSWGHGEVFGQSDQKFEPYQERLSLWLAEELPKAAQSNQLFHNAYLDDLFLLYQNHDSAMFQKLLERFKSIKALRYLLYYSQWLRPPPVKIIVIKALVQGQDEDFYPMCASLIDKLDMGADYYYLKELSEINFDSIKDKAILDALNKKFDAMYEVWERVPLATTMAIVNNFVNQNLFVEKAINIARGLCQKEDYIKFGLELFANIVSKGNALEEADILATKFISSDDPYIRLAAYDVFEKLIEKGAGLQNAFNIVQDYFARPDPVDSVVMLRLLRKLVEHGYKSDQALEIVRKFMPTSNSSILLARLAVLSALVDQGIGYQEALQEAKTGFLLHYQGQPLKIFMQLFAKGLGYKDAIEVALPEISSSDSMQRDSAVYLFSGMFEYGQGFEEALEAVGRETQSKDISVRETAYELLNRILSHNRGFELLPTIAMNTIASENPLVVSRMVRYLGKLVENDKAYNAALVAVQKAIELRKEYLVYDLLGKLVEKGQAYALAQEVIQTALKTGIETQNDSLIASALILLAKLVKQGESISLAKEELERNSSNRSIYVQNALFELKETLKEKGIE